MSSCLENGGGLTMDSSTLNGTGFVCCVFMEVAMTRSLNNDDGLTLHGFARNSMDQIVRLLLGHGLSCCDQGFYGDRGFEQRWWVNSACFIYSLDGTDYAFVASSRRTCGDDRF